MNLEEFDKKAYELGRQIEEILIELSRLRDAKELMFVVDVMPVIKSFDTLISQARTAIKVSEISLKIGESNV